MRIFLTILLLQIATFGYGHDIRLAIFEISEGQSVNQLILNISFDKDDLELSLTMNYPQISQGVKNDLIRKYVNENFQISLNSNSVELIINSIKYDDEFVRLTASITEFNESIKQIRVFNTCLIDYTEEHSNIIKSKLYDKVRSFRLTEDRISTVIDYSEM